MILKRCLVLAGVASCALLIALAAPVGAGEPASQARASCGEIIPNCLRCEGAGSIYCIQCVPGYGVLGGRCQNCGSITANCTSCKNNRCEGCAAGFELQNKSCVPCTGIDPKCTACSGGQCTGCASGYGVAGNGTSCQACNTIDPNCTSCKNGQCTGCASGYGVAGNGTSCQACNTIDPNCTSCSNGKCNTCANGFAANLAGQCVPPGTSTCSFDVGGQCCKCQYDCQGWNPASGSCAGAPSNGCGGCQSRQ
ncbi:MAG TPA: hypothetical protein PK413_06530 [Thermoanaerobaculia bacterium]|nr:hypothetical protein [Thermoanaerobaculia bacterium]